METRLVLPPAPQAMQHLIEHGGLLWLDMLYPQQEQIEALRKQFAFHPLHLDDVLSRVQRPKIDDSADPAYVFLVLHFPVFNEMARVSVVSEVEFFVGTDYVITTHDGRLRALMHLVHDAERQRGRDEIMGRGPGYLLYKIVERLINACFPMLTRMDEKLEDLESHIFERDVRATVEQLSYLRRDIISLRKIVRPNLPVLQSLASRHRTFLGLDEETYFGDLVDALSKIWDMLEEHKQIVEGLDATLGSLTSHRINQEMKIFTLISVIVLPMTLVASILGMNVPIPFANHPLALAGSLAVMLLLAGAFYLFFRWRQWV